MFPFVKPSFELQSVKLKTPTFDLKRNLLKSPTLPWIPVSVDSRIAMETIRSEAPIDGTDIVHWMHVAAADNAVFGGMCEEYNRLGSVLLSGSGDGYIPGVSVGNLSVTSVQGSTVRSQGYGTVVTPRGNFNVPTRGKSTFAVSDILAWGALPDPGTGIQWVMSILQWRDLASLPVTDRVRFAGSSGMVAPNFFSVSPLPVPLTTLRMGLTSDKPQTMVIMGRGTSGAFQDVLFEDKFDIEAGESEVLYHLMGFPAVPSFTLGLQPSDGTSTIADYIETIP